MKKKVTMFFHCAGIISKEKFEIREETDTIVILDTDENINRCFIFNKNTGQCLNDETIFDCKRTIKPLK